MPSGNFVHRWNEDGPRRDFDNGGPNRGPNGPGGNAPPMMMMNDNRLPPRFKKMALNNELQQQRSEELKRPQGCSSIMKNLA